MIRINLIPENLRKKRNAPQGGGEAGPSGGLSKGKIIGLIGGFCFLLLLAALGLQGLIFMKTAEKKDLEAKMASINPSKMATDQVLQDLKGLKGRMDAIDKITSRKKVHWAPKLNAISNALPRGVWLSRISLEGDVLLIKGSAVSKDKTEMIHVHNFRSSLKGSEPFMTDLTGLELGLIKSRTIKNTPIADFTISAQIEK